jgi:FKBP-type peptidyl-prolyl cis-trans isomerase (trigger factor)
MNLVLLFLFYREDDAMFLKRILNLIIAASLLLVMLSSCAGASTVKISEMTLDELEKCVLLCQYKDLELKLGENTKEAALLSYIDKNSSIKKYPTGAVDYYFEQLKAQYRYYADEADMRYEAMLDELGEDNVTMKAEARRLVKNDLIFELIRKKEGITLTDEEKTAFFDRYVKKYAESYKYSEEYVREELSSLVYDSMIYDKTVEFLIIHNSFVE